MAVTSIHPIKMTLGKAIDYCMADKVEVLKDDVADAIAYAKADKVSGKAVYETFTSTLNCTAENATAEFEKIREIHRQGTKRKSGNLAYHVIQSFDESIDPKIANEIGHRLAEECFEKHQCIISTHSNTENTHNHIVFNAWEIGSGKKYYDCNKTYAKIREVSDKLCEEYGFNVLEKTKNYKPVKYVDSAGKTKFFEPTDRKKAIRQGEFANSNDYRNTDEYAFKEKFEKTNRSTIKEDIDRLIPNVKSYDELLMRLRQLGYKIHDKKVNGDWLSHVSFKAPLQDKFTRDGKIGEDYTRERLTEIIKNNFERSAEPEEQTGEPTINIEKLIRADVENLNNKVSDEFNSVIRNNMEGKVPLSGDKRESWMTERINAGLRTLEFIANEDIKSISQLDEMRGLLIGKQKETRQEINKLSAYITKLGESIVIIDKLNALDEKIKRGGDELYCQLEKQGDEALLIEYTKVLSERGLGDKATRDRLKVTYEKYKMQYRNLAIYMKAVDAQVAEYNQHYKVLDIAKQRSIPPQETKKNRGDERI